MSDTPIKPVALAKVLKIPPQKIYGLLKGGRINNYQEGEGAALVKPSEVVEALDNPRRRGRPTNEEVFEELAIEKGTVVSWVVEVQKQVAVVEKVGENLTTMQKMLENKSKRPQLTHVKNNTLAGHIKNNHFTTDTEFRSILEAIAYALTLRERPQLASRLLEISDEMAEDTNAKTQ